MVLELDKTVGRESTHDAFLLPSTQSSPIGSYQCITTLLELRDIDGEATQRQHLREPGAVKPLCAYDNILYRVIGEPRALLAVRCVSEVFCH